MMIVDDFKDREGNWVRSFKWGKSTVRTLSGCKYSNMRCRCIVGGLHQSNKPSYIGCKSDFASFQDFTNWHVDQIGYNLGFELDKDLLTKGNKIYSKDTCILLPGCLNVFFASRQSKSSPLPAGVRTHGTKYRSAISRHGKPSHIGVFNTPEEAFNVYKIAKESQARVLAEKWKSQIDPRAYEALMSYEVLITD